MEEYNDDDGWLIIIGFVILVCVIIYKLIWKMEKLVFDYTYCSEPECWEWNIPFEYESKEKFILDVLENPMILDKLGITSVYQWQIEDGTIFEEDYVKNVDECVLTLEEWFHKNKVWLYPLFLLSL